MSLADVLRNATAQPAKGSPLASLPYAVDVHALLIKAAAKLDSAALSSRQWDRLPEAQEALEAVLRLDRVSIDAASACAAIRVLWDYMKRHAPSLTADGCWAFDVHPAVLARVAQVLTLFMKRVKFDVPLDKREVVTASDLVPYIDALLFPNAASSRVLQEPEIALAHAIVGLAREARRWFVLQGDNHVISCAFGTNIALSSGQLCAWDMDTRVRSVCIVALLHSGLQPLPAWLDTRLWTSGSRRLETMSLLHLARNMKHCGGSVSASDAAAVFAAFASALKLPEPRLCGPRIAGLGPSPSLPERQTSLSATGLRIVRDHMPAAHAALSKWVSIALHVCPNATAAALESWTACVRPLCVPSNSGSWTESLAHFLAGLTNRLAAIDAYARGEEDGRHTAYSMFKPLDTALRDRIGAVLWSLAEPLAHGKNPFLVLSVLQAMRPLAHFWPGAIPHALSLASAGLMPFAEAHRVLAGLGALTAVCPLLSPESVKRPQSRADITVPLTVEQSRNLASSLLPLAVDRIDCSDTMQTVHALAALECASLAGLVNDDVGLQAVSRMISFARTQSHSGLPAAADAAVYNIAGQSLTAVLETLSTSAQKAALDDLFDLLATDPPEGAAGVLATAIARASAVLTDSVSRMLLPLLDACTADISKAPAPSSGRARECSPEAYARLHWRLCALVGLVRHSPAATVHSDRLWAFLCGLGASLTAEPCVRALGSLAKAICRSQIDRYPISASYGIGFLKDSFMSDGTDIQVPHTSIGSFTDGQACKLQWNMAQPTHSGLASFIGKVRTRILSQCSSTQAAACDLARYAMDCMVMHYTSASDDADMLATPLVSDLISLALCESVQTRTRAVAIQAVQRATEYRLRGRPGAAAGRLSLSLASNRCHAGDTRHAPRLQMLRALSAHRCLAGVRARLNCVAQDTNAVHRISLLAFAPYAVLREPAQSVILSSACRTCVADFAKSVLLPLISNLSFYTGRSASGTVLKSAGDCNASGNTGTAIMTNNQVSVDNLPIVKNNASNTVPDINWSQVLDLIVANAKKSQSHASAMAKGAAYMASNFTITWMATAANDMATTTSVFAAIIQSPLHTAFAPGERISEILVRATEHIVSSAYGIRQFETADSDAVKMAERLKNCASTSLKALTHTLQLSAAAVAVGAGSELCEWVLSMLSHDVAPVRSLAVHRAPAIAPYAGEALAQAALTAFLPWALLEGHVGQQSQLVFRAPIEALYRSLGCRMGSGRMFAAVQAVPPLASVSAETYRQRGVLEALVSILILSSQTSHNSEAPAEQCIADLSLEQRVAASGDSSIKEACNALASLVNASVLPVDSTRMWNAAGRHAASFIPNAQLVVDYLLATHQTSNGQRAQMLAFVRGLCTLGAHPRELSSRDVYSLHQAVRVESAGLLLCTARQGSSPEFADPWKSDGTVDMPRAYSLIALLEMAAQDPLATRLDSWIAQALPFVVSLSKLPDVSPLARRALQQACGAIASAESAIRAILQLLSSISGTPLSCVQAAVDCCLSAYARHAPTLAIVAVVGNCDLHTGETMGDSVLNEFTDGHLSTVAARSGADVIADRTLVLLGRTDVTIECRGAVSSLLSAVLSSSPSLCARLSTAVRTKAMSPDATLLVCAALMLAHPYTVPAYLPAVLSRAASLVRRRPMPPAWLVAHVRRVFLDFARTHADTWHAIDRAQFSEAELDSVSDLLSAPSYYA